MYLDPQHCIESAPAALFSRIHNIFQFLPCRWRGTSCRCSSHSWPQSGSWTLDQGCRRTAPRRASDHPSCWEKPWAASERPSRFDPPFSLKRRCAPLAAVDHPASHVTMHLGAKSDASSNGRTTSEGWIGKSGWHRYQACRASRAENRKETKLGRWNTKLTFSTHKLFKGLTCVANLNITPNQDLKITLRTRAESSGYS